MYVYYINMMRQTKYDERNDFLINIISSYLGSQNAANQKNNLIFWGLDPDNLEVSFFNSLVLESIIKVSLISH